MSQTKKILVAAVAVAAAGWLYASPYLSVNAMKNAAVARDAEGINSRVDFPALKESIKGQFAAKAMAEAAKAPDDSPFAAAGAALGMMMIGPMVDAMITPDAVAMMMRGEKPSPQAAAGESSRMDRDIDTSMGYRDFNTFAVTARDAAESGSEPITMIFKRNGITSWKLTAVELPM